MVLFAEARAVHFTPPSRQVFGGIGFDSRDHCGFLFAATQVLWLQPATTEPAAQAREADNRELHHTYQPTRILSQQQFEASSGYPENGAGAQVLTFCC